MVLEELLACTPVSQLSDRYNSTAGAADTMLNTEVNHSPRRTEKKGLV